MNDAGHVIERDGARYRWAFYVGGRRVAKAAQWWDTEEQAEQDFHAFCDAAGDADVRAKGSEHDA